MRRTSAAGPDLDLADVPAEGTRQLGPFPEPPPATARYELVARNTCGQATAAAIARLRPAPRPADWPLGEGPFRAGFRLVTDIPISEDIGTGSATFAGITFERPRNNRAIVFYPAAGDGEGSPFAGGGPFPVIVFGHAKRLPRAECPGTLADTTQDFRQLSGVLSHLARWGFVAISPDLHWLVQGSAGERQLLLADALRYLVTENQRRGSPFRRRLDTGLLAAMGHSFGGYGAVLLAASGTFPIRALALIAPAGGAESVGQVAPRPLLVLHGTEENSGFGVDDTPLSVYGAAGPPKHLVTIGGANHFGYTDALCVADDAGTLAAADQQRIARAYLTAFFRRYLQGAVTLGRYLSPGRLVEELEAFEIGVDTEL
jgi:dienelactone hydrolase